MKVTYLQNAGVIIENLGEKILCDPWLVDGCYYGSWHHYPKFDLILKLISKAYDKFEKQRKMMNYSTDTVILIKLDNEKLILIPLNGDGFKIIKSNEMSNFQKYIYLSLDNRLLFRILEGSKKANWDNAEIGCHILWKRVSNIYDRSLFYCLNFVHN